MESDFLPGFPSRVQQSVADTGKSRPDEKIFFRIFSGKDGVFRLAPVNSRGECVNPDPKYYRGEVAAMLRSVDNINRENRFAISWGTPAEEGVSLKSHPYLLYQLLRCDNVVGPDNKPLLIAEEPAVPELVITTEENMLRPRWRLRCQEPEGKETDPAVGEEVQMDFRPVTENFVLHGGMLYRVESLGENYTNLEYFASPVADDMVEPYLSVVYSYVENFRLVYGNRKVEWSRENIDPTPTVMFEKVDPDMALHIRVGSMIRGLNEEFLKRFELTRTATVGMEGKIVVRDINPRPLEVDVNRVRELIEKYAPTKKEARTVYEDGDCFIIPQNVAGPFLLRGLPTLISEFTLMGTDKLKEYKVSPMKPKLKMRFNSGIDFLEGDASVEVGDESISLGKLFEQYRRDRYVTLSDGTRAVLDGGYMKRLERLFGDKRTAGKNVRINYFDLPDIEELLNSKLDPKLFERQRKVYEGFNELKDLRLIIPTLKATLRPYQAEGVKWIRYLYDNNLSGCLADDMGLGKTIQTIAMLSTIYPVCKLPTLIVMPRSLLFNWQSEIARFNPSLSVYTYYLHTRDIDEAVKHNVILTTYALVRNDIEKFSKQKFEYVILDESQNIKNIEAQITRSVYMLEANHRLALSGTPVENNLSELYSLFRFLNPGMLGDLDDFNRRYSVPIQREDDKEAMAALRRRIFPFMLRRLKRDVLTELPDRIEQTLFVEMEHDQAEFYEQRRRFYHEKVNETIATEGLNKSQFVMFQALTELRRIASVPESLSDGRIHSPKIEELIENMSEAVANGHKCVAFFNYIAGLEIVGERLKALGIDFESMTGATTNRSKVIHRFNDDPECMVLLMTLKTGGVGLNLTVADTVFIFEPWWNKAAEEQAINRLHRIGQTAKVHSYSLITRGTIEEKIRELQERKSQLFDDLISADSSSSKQLSADDINFILGK